MHSRSAVTCLAASMAALSTIALDYPDDLRLLSYNLYSIESSDWANIERSEALVKALDDPSLPFAGNDVIILNELFHEEPSDILLEGWKREYPHQTPVLGRQPPGDAGEGCYSSKNEYSGGVAVVSRYPIDRTVEHVYCNCNPDLGIFSDCKANKGFTYVRINKNGKYYHVIGTHMSAFSDPTAVEVRKKQFQEIRDFVDSQQIPATEVLFIGGDMNVDKIHFPGEYEEMLDILNANAPDNYVGHDVTFDVVYNYLAAYQYRNLYPSEYLDYIFVSKAHAQPSHWENNVMDIVSEQRFAEQYEFSDHYPVAGYSYANEQTVTRSYRASNEPYLYVGFCVPGSSTCIRANPERSVAFLQVDDSLRPENANNVLDFYFDVSSSSPEWNKIANYRSVATCIRSGDLIQVRTHTHPNLFWNWSVFLRTYTYYPTRMDPSDNLRVNFEGNGCLKNGDIVTLSDAIGITNSFNPRRLLEVDGSRLKMDFFSKEASFPGEIEDKHKLQVVIFNEPQFHDYTDQVTYEKTAEAV